MWIWHLILNFLCDLYCKEVGEGFLVSFLESSTWANSCFVFNSKCGKYARSFGVFRSTDIIIVWNKLPTLPCIAIASSAWHRFAKLKKTICASIADGRQPPLSSSVSVTASLDVIQGVLRLLSSTGLLCTVVPTYQVLLFHPFHFPLVPTAYFSVFQISPPFTIPTT